jgi:hypothetical protein
MRHPMDGGARMVSVLESKRGGGAMSLEVGSPAPDFTLPDSLDRPTSLAALWRERPLALVFLRHFG